MRRSVEQADVEQCGELRLELAVEIAELGVVARDPQRVGAQVDEELHAALEPGEQAQQPVRGRNERLAQRCARPRAGCPSPSPPRSRRRPFRDPSRSRGRACSKKLRRPSSESATYASATAAASARWVIVSCSRSSSVMTSRQASRVTLGEAGREVERGPSGRAPKSASAEPIEEPAGRHRQRFSRRRRGR